MLKINYYIKVFDESANHLEDCVKSISNTQYPHSMISMMSSENNLPLVTDFLNQNSLKKNTNNVFNKDPFGIPTLCFGYGKGKISNKDALSHILQTTLKYTDIYVILNANDLININYPYEIINSFNESSLTKIVYSDYFLGGKRIYSDPYTKDLFLADKIKLSQFAFKADVLSDNDLETDEDLLVKNIILNNFMAIQKPKPLYTKKI